VLLAMLSACVDAPQKRQALRDGRWG